MKSDPIQADKSRRPVSRKPGGSCLTMLGAFALFGGAFFAFCMLPGMGYVGIAIGALVGLLAGTSMLHYFIWGRAITKLLADEASRAPAPADEER